MARKKRTSTEEPENSQKENTELNIEKTIDTQTKDEEDEKQPPIPSELYLLPLRDSVVYPMLIAPLQVARDTSIQLIDDALASNNRIIGVIAQKNYEIDQPKGEDVYSIGCAVIIRTLVKMPDAVRMIVQGISRFRITEILQEKPYLKAKIEVIEEPLSLDENPEEIEALKRSLTALFDQAVRLSPNLPEELRSLTQAVQEPNVMADLMAAHLAIGVEQKQRILEIIDLKERLKTLLEILAHEVRVLELTSKVQSEVSAEISKSQREYLLREQLKAIQKELGEIEDRGEELEELKEKIEAAKMPEEAQKEVKREYDRLRRISPGSPEYSVARTYIDWMLAMPWNTSTKENLDLSQVQKVMDDEHYGLAKIKERIVEFLAVHKVKGPEKVRQPILCLVGPPGVGKTSLARSVANAMQRKFVHASLGGMRDEAEIRGHRRTYVGALPGQIIQGIRRAETNNPVFVLDEIDKLGSDFHGDPSSALLEVLDPEQNDTFRDHYLDVPFDLSRVFFIATANRLDTIPDPLRDRMEVIEVSGYTEQEKCQIATRHLIPRQIEEHGLKPSQIVFKDDAVHMLIRNYTREAGVRNLEREIATLTRKVTRQFAEGRRAARIVNPKLVQQLLGAPRYTHDKVEERELIPGMAIGLAWTPVGGDILFIEATTMPGAKGLLITGQLGDVMKESVSTALSYIRSHIDEFHLDPTIFEKSEIHVHVPAGAVPKDGPSAGITMLTALTSLFTKQVIKPRLAMTGEITLMGHVLPVGGIKEKVLAAYAAGVKELILPEENRKDYQEDITVEIRRKLKIHYVKQADEVLKIALQGHLEIKKNL